MVSICDTLLYETVLSRFIMAELLQTERTYVKDLETCINVSLQNISTEKYL